MSDPKLATTMTNSVERALPPLDLTGSLSQVAERWTLATVETIVSVIDGKGITNPAWKKAQLLHLAGMVVQDIYEDLPDPGPVNDAVDGVSSKTGCSFSSRGQRAIWASTV